jgi:hypothetical protein
MASATVSRAITYTFGSGDVDVANVWVATEVTHPLTKDVGFDQVQVFVELPSTGWSDSDVLKAVQDKFPDFTIAWAE